MNQQAVPEGYMRNSQGALIPLDMVKEIDKARDELVKEIVAKALQLAALLGDFKTKSMNDIAAFVELSAERYGAKLGGKKGNVILHTFDGEYRITRAINETMAFDERIQIAKQLIGECLTEWSAGSRSEIRVLIDNAFQVDKQGNINTQRILGLRRLDIKDEKWLKAMEAISDSLQASDSKSYIRIYKRNKGGGYDLVNLNVSA